MGLSWQTIQNILTMGGRNPRDDYQLIASQIEPPRDRCHSHRRRSLSNVGLVFLRYWTPRRVLYTLLCLFLLFVSTLLASGVPPSYADIWDFESRFPQNNISAYTPGVRRYLHISGQVVGHGLNNALQESLLHSHLANLANRSYVFEDYVWSWSPVRWTIYDYALRPARLPLNAFIAGPTAGQPSHSPPAVSKKFWQAVCPPEKKTVIKRPDSPFEADAAFIVTWWLGILAETEDECVEIDARDYPVFDASIYGEDRMLTIWDSYVSSPIIQNFEWSHLIQSAVIRNFITLETRPVEATANAPTPVGIPGLVAVHIRQGDYKRHCPRLADWGSRYMAVNQIETLPDRFDPSPYSSSHELTRAYYMKHCLPTTEEIVQRLHDVREANPNLKRVYVSTNAWWWFVDGLKAALAKDGWQDFSSSLDIVLDGEQRYVAMAVDMAIADRAEVFLGNGFSSLTSNIVMLRLAKGLDPLSNRFL